MNKWLLIFGMLIATTAMAQRPGGGRPNMANMPAEGIVKGQVVDELSGETMEYANVVIYSMRDSSVVAGTVTAPDGTFRMEKVRYGRFYIIANFIGFDKLYISDKKITPKSKVLDLGIIKLHPSSTNLEGVEITADKDHVEYKIDKKIVNVSQDILAAGSSAVEVLENTPSIQVDIEGNVSMRGTSNFTVLIDGRPSVLSGSDALQQIPASTIENIEIITNPSAKYDPDGVGGIINVVMKKQKTKGFNGVINTSIASGNKYKVDALLNYRTGKFNVFGGVNYNYREFSMNGHTDYETYYDTTQYRTSDMNGNMHRKGYGFKAGMDYYLTDKSTLTFSGDVGGYGFGRNLISTNTLTTFPETPAEYPKSESESHGDGSYYKMNLNYIHKFDDEGKKLELNGYYSRRNGEDWANQFEYSTDMFWNSLETEPATIRTNEKDDDFQFRINADYTMPFGEDGKFEAGYQSRINFQNQKYIYSDFDYAVSDWIENPLYSSTSDFKRNIHSMYATFANSYGNWGYMLGLRGEYTDRSIKNEKDVLAHAINRLDYFPSVHLSKQFEGGHQLLASYSKRIDRPGGRELDPFVSYMDAYNIRVGNPLLEPEYIDSYELSYQKKFEKSFYSAEGYYRINKNKITHIKTLQEDGVMQHSFINLNKDYSLGVELMANMNLTDWFTLNMSMNVFDYRLDGNLEDEDVSTQSTNWDGRVNATFKLKNDFRIQLTSFYRGPSVTVQGTRKGYYVSNIAARKDFFDHRLNTTLSVRDIFKSAKREMTISGTGYTSYDLFRHEAPIVSLNISYIINNYRKEMGKDDRENGNGDAEMDLGM